MTLPDKILVQTGTAIVLANAGAHSPAAGNDLGADTADGLSLASVADDAAQQSDKVDLTASWARRWVVTAAIEFAATPTAGEAVEFYWSPSHSVTDATGNPGFCSGADAAYTGQSSNLEDSLKQLVFIGAMVTTALLTGNIQVAEVGVFSPTQRYGCLVVVNRSGAAVHSDNVEHSVRLAPIEDIIED